MITKIFALKKTLTIELLSFSLLFSVALFAPLFGSQAVAGILVNAAIFLAVMFVGIKGAFLVALFPSMIALSTGLLPVVFAPMIPFIMAGNVILALLFNYFQENFWKGVLIGSFFKFLFLFLSVSFLASNILNENLAGQIVTMMTWPQFLTALGGGLVAYVVSGLVGIEKE